MKAAEEYRKLASNQLGLLTALQLRMLGAGQKSVQHRVESGEFERLSRRVLRVAGSPDTPAQRALAAVLDADQGAALSHASAAHWWGVPGFDLEPFQVTTRRLSNPVPDRLARVHRIRSFDGRHRTVLNLVPVVRPELLALQLCGSHHPARAERAFDRMWSMRLLSGRSTRRVLDEVAGSGVRGVTALRALLDVRGPDYVPPASHLEARFAQVLREGGRDPMDRQVDLGDEDNWCGRVDFADMGSSRRALIEVDSERFHTALVDLETDRRRQEHLERAGFVVGRVTDVQVFHHPRDVLSEVDRVRRVARLGARVA
jgi:hypothetical protein